MTTLPYYWTPNSGTNLYAVHYSPSSRWIEESTWYDSEEQMERTEGGFALTYKTQKKPLYGLQSDLLSDFIKVSRQAFSPQNVKKSIPECAIFMDKQPKWWSSNEYQESKRLLERAQAIMISSIRDSYSYFDAYDDEFIDD